MNVYTRQEISVGLFVTLGALALAYLSLELGGLKLMRDGGSTVSARFSSVGSLKVGDPIKIAGVDVGEVSAIRLVDFEAEADLGISKSVVLPEDSIASIQSAGLLGDAYVSISPGASDRDLEDGGKITRTEPAVSFTDLLAKYAFGSPTQEGDTEASGDTGENDDPLGILDPTPSPATTNSASDAGAIPTDTAKSAAPTSPATSKKNSVFKDPLE